MSMLQLVAWALICSLGFAHGAVSAQTLEKKQVTIAVGGKASLYYLPLSLAERLGYFKDEGLTVEIFDFAGGAKSLQAMMGGSADIVSGGFDHVIVLQARGQRLQAFVLQNATPAISLGIVGPRQRVYQSLADLKGMKIGVTAPGSSTHMFVNQLLSKGGLARDDVAIIGVGTGASALAAVRAHQIDAIANIEPVITMLERSGDIKIVAETLSEKGSVAVFGAALPAGSLYTKRGFIEANPNTVQALTTAMVRALLWLGSASAEDVAKVVPAEYLLGDRALYLAAFSKARQSYSKNGLIPPAGAQALHNTLAGFEPAVQKGSVRIEDTYDNRFVRQALDRYGHGAVRAPKGPR